MTFLNLSGGLLGGLHFTYLLLLIQLHRVMAFTGTLKPFKLEIAVGSIQTSRIYVYFIRQ